MKRDRRRRAQLRLAAPRLIEVALCVAATAAGGVLYGDFFATTGYLPPVCAASFGGALVAVVAAARRWRLGRTLLSSVVGFALLATYGVFLDTVEYLVPTPRTASELAWGVVGGWARMLTVGLPADVRGELLVTPALFTWAAAFTAATLAMRTRSALAPVAPPLAAFVAALLFVAKLPGTHVAVTGAFLAATLLLVLLRANRAETVNSGGSTPPDTQVPGIGEAGQRWQAIASQLVFGMPAIVAVALLGIVGGHILPLASGEHRFDPRALRPPPVQIADTLTPLAKIKSQLREEPPRQLFTVRIGGGGARSPVDRIRVAALEEFDGVLWTSVDSFLLAGHQLAADPALTTAQPVPAHIVVDDLAGPFLPVLGWLTRLDLPQDSSVRVGFSDSSGVLVTTEQTLRGFTYDILGQVSPRDDGLLLVLPSATPEFLRHTSLPDSLPPQMRALAQQLTQKETTPYGKLVAIERYLRTLPYSLDAQPGHSYATLSRLLTGAKPHDNEGYAEQHAAAFAVLARVAGFPTRVAVGYRLHDSHDGIYTVTTRDAHAWAEVHFDGYGWVSFEPTDTARIWPDPRGQPNPNSGSIIGPPQPNPPLVPPPFVEPSPNARDLPGTDWGGVLLDMAIAAIILVSLAALAAVLTVAEKARRRQRRRRAGSNAARVLGAWQEATDRLVERGVTVPVALTAREVAEHAEGALGEAASAVARLAPLATAAVFSLDQLDEQVVEHAWQLEAQLRHHLYPGRVPVRRLRASLDPRPLLTGWRDARQGRRALKQLGVG